MRTRGLTFADALRTTALSLALLAGTLAGCGGGSGSDERASMTPREPDGAVNIAPTPDPIPPLSSEGSQPGSTLPPPAPPSTQPVVDVAESSFLFRALPASSLFAATGRIQCNGQNLAGTATPVTGVGLDGQTEVKHAIEADSSSGFDSVYTFRITRNDPPTSGVNAQRCERYFSANGQALPQGRDLWFGVRLKTDNAWGAGTSRIIWQWHEASTTSGLSPHLSATVNGDNLRIIVNHNNNETLSSATTSRTTIFNSNIWTPGVWRDFVVQAHVDPSPGGAGFVKVWMDGQVIADYTGPVGYRYSQPRDYAKIGIYHWNSAANRWLDEAAQELSARYSGALAALHEPGYTHDSIRRLLAP